MRYCNIEDCDKKSWCKTYCVAHYGRWYRWGTPHKVVKERHGLNGTPIQSRWSHMISRCYSKKRHNYHRYGGRGIEVCDRWRHSITNFYKDMGDPPTPQHTLDRIDNDKGYSPENCKWSLPIEQQRNMSVRSDSKTGVKGVTVYKRRYLVQITANFKHIHLGTYDELEEAISARLTGEALYW